MPQHRHLYIRAVWLAVTVLTLVPVRLWAFQPPDSGIRPADFGFKIPQGPLKPGGGRRVTTADAAGNPVVALLHVEVGENCIVMLPDGRLEVRSASEATATDRPFEPISVDALAQRLTTGEFQGFKVKKAARYLFVYNTSDEFALAAARILETMFRGVVLYAHAQKIDVHPPAVPLVVVMFRSEEEMNRHRRLPPGMAAYYHTVENRVYLSEQSRHDDVKPELAVRQKMSTIAHEGAHQILNNIGVQQRLSVWPTWLAEGLAEFFAPTTTARGLAWKGAGEANDFRLSELEQYLKSSGSEGGALVEQTAGAARLASTGYASAWSLVHYLAISRRNDFKNYLNEASRLGPLEGDLRVFAGGIVPGNLTSFKTAFGSDLAEIERRMLLHLRRLPYRDPYADWPHYVVAIAHPNSRSPQRQANAFHSKRQAQQWRDRALAAMSEADRAASQTAIREFDNRALAERFARQFLAGQP